MINQQLDSRITEWLNAHREELVAQWMELVRIPSLQEESAQGAPFGMPCKKALEKAADYYAQAGISVKIEEDGYYALAEYGKGEKTIGLFGHCDVVSAGEGWCLTEPFDPLIKNGYLVGRGSGDNKSGVMASLAVMRIFKELNIPLKSRLFAFVGPNEESGMADIRRFTEQEKMPDLSLVPDSSFPCCLGEKSILRFMTERDTSFRDILDFSGGQAMNVVLDEATVTLRKKEGLTEELLARIVGRKEYALTVQNDTVHLKSYGVPKHAGNPEGSVNAAVLAAALLQECNAICEEDRACMKQLTLWLTDYWGSGFGIAHTDPEFGKLTVANGIVRAENGRLSFSADIRFGTNLDHLETENKITRLLQENGWRITFINNRKGFKADKTSLFPNAFVALYHALTGAKGKPYYMSGGTYARYLNNAFAVGTQAFDAGSRAVRLDLPEGHGGAHQRDEIASIDAYLQAVRVLVHYILESDRLLNE